MYECGCYGIGSGMKAMSCGSGFGGICPYSSQTDLGVDIVGATSMRATSMCGCAGNAPGIIPESGVMQATSCGCSDAYAIVPETPGMIVPSSAFDPMGAYLPEIRYNAKAFAGYQKDGSPVFTSVAMNRGRYMGYDEQGYPVYMATALTDVNWMNVVATAAISVGGLAFGWVVAGAIVDYFK